MGYRGRIRNGAVVFEEPVSLPEGTVVEVVVPEAHENKELTLDLERFRGILPANLDARDAYRRGLLEKHR